MVLLKALNLSAVTPDVLQFFAGQQIVTVEDFLVHDLQSLGTKVEGRLESAAFNQAVVAVLSYLEKLQDGWSMASDLLEKNGLFHPISCESVDSLLNGGLQEGTITELVGPASTGKSQAAVSVASRFFSGVIYLDTCHSFSARRVAQIVDNLLGFNEPKVEDQWDLVCLVMKGIHRVGICDIFSMLSFLHSLHGSLQSKVADKFPRLRLLVIDSASSVVSPILGGNNARGHALMICLARSLNKLAVVNRIAILITNHTVSGSDGQIQPALGESWISVPHVRLWFARDSNSDLCAVSLTKHTSLECNKQAAFYIGATGLQSVDGRRNVSIPFS